MSPTVAFARVHSEWAGDAPPPRAYIALPWGMALTRRLSGRGGRARGAAVQSSRGTGAMTSVGIIADRGEFQCVES